MFERAVDKVVNILTKEGQMNLTQLKIRMAECGIKPERILPAIKEARERKLVKLTRSLLLSASS